MKNVVSNVVFFALLVEVAMTVVSLFRGNWAHAAAWLALSAVTLFLLRAIPE